ncbi:MAG: hypothetical protein JXR89_12785 [Deltaproteobacteria bacterium]|nr:hypothetical protein [Deltaproteobacteria bacterium]
MLILASLCFPDQEKSCFFCCPPIRDPEADPLDDILKAKTILRRNRLELEKNLATPVEISGNFCWGLGFLDDEEKQAGCLLHPVRHQGRDLRGLTGYQFKCANALCREAQVFAKLSQDEQQVCLSLCRGMDSLHYSSRRNPLMRLLLWGEEIVEILIAERYRAHFTAEQSGPGRKPPSAPFNSQFFLNDICFLWQKLDARLDAYLALTVINRYGLDFFRNHVDRFIEFRNHLAASLRKDYAGRRVPTGSPSHELKIPLSFSRFLKFAAGLWELPPGCENDLNLKVENDIRLFFS